MIIEIRYNDVINGEDWESNYFGEIPGYLEAHSSNLDELINHLKGSMLIYIGEKYKSVPNEIIFKVLYSGQMDISALYSPFRIQFDNT